MPTPPPSQKTKPHLFSDAGGGNVDNSDGRHDGNHHDDEDADGGVAHHKQWRCDICQNAFFDDFDEAVQHEDLCRLSNQTGRIDGTSDSQQQQQQPQKGSNSNRKLSFDDENETGGGESNSVGYVHGQSNCMDGRGNTHEDDNDDNGEKNEKMQQMANPTDTIHPLSFSSSTSSSSSSSITASSKKPVKNNVHPFFTQHRSKTEATSSKTSQAIGTSFFLPHKPKEQQESSQKNQTKKRKHTQNTSSSSSTNQPAIEGSSHVLSSSSSKGSKKTKTIQQDKSLKASSHATGQPPSSEPTNDTATSTTTSKTNRKSDNTKKKSSTKPTSGGAGGRTKGSSSSSKNNNPSEDFINDEVLKSSPQLASIFQNKSSKQILAEQRLAEFQVRRDIERQKERERQARRALMFDTTTNNNDNSSNNGNNNHRGMDRQTSTSSSSSRSLKKMKLLPLAPRFPVPNHSIGKDDDRTVPTVNDSSSLQLADTAVWNGSNCSTSRSVEQQQHPTVTDGVESSNRSTLFASLSPLDAISSTSTTIQQALADALVPPKTIQNKSKGRHDGHMGTMKSNVCWNEKYGMGHGLVGSDAEQVYLQLVEMINFWKAARHETMKRMDERQRKFQAKNGAFTTKKANKPKKKKKKKKSNKDGYYGYEDNDFIVDDDEDYELEDEDELSKLCLLIGPPSSGKTSFVHYVAQRQNCTVVEINTSRARSGAALKSSIQEATQSTSTLGKFQSKKPTSNSFFAPKTKKETVTEPKKMEDHCLIDSDDDDDDEEINRSRKQEELQRLSLTIVLIDEVDILYEEDSGFWSALVSVVKSTKCPIILTANQCPPNLISNSQLPFQIIETKRPSPLECAKKVLQVCQHERIEIQPNLRSRGPEITHDKLASIAQVSDCDLRRMLLELQLFAASATFSFQSSIDRTIASGTCLHDNKLPSFEGVEWRPKIDSVSPTTVPMYKYSILSLKGENFLRLANANSDAVVWVGTTKCRHRVIDDQMILVLCPPRPETSCVQDMRSTYCTRLVDRVSSIDLECPSLGLFKTSSTVQTVVSTTMMNDNVIQSTRRLSIIHDYNENSASLQAIESEDDEIEDFTSHDDEDHQPAISLECTVANEKEGDSLWQATLSKLTERDSSFDTDASTAGFVPTDHESVHGLENRSRIADTMSDAALLEDDLFGRPFLSGASRGFAFDYTEECVGKRPMPDMLRMRDGSQIPTEEKLIELGWKDDCGFYGDADTEMTLSSTSCSRRQMNDVMNRSRGSVAVAGALTLEARNQPTVDLSVDDFSDDDLHDYSVRMATLSIEDQYLPYPVVPTMQQLPGLLRGSVQCETVDGLDRQHFKQQKRLEERFVMDQRWMDSLLPRHADRAGWSYGRFGSRRATVLGDVESYGDLRDVLELLPILRCIAFIEQAAEHASLLADQQHEASCRRSSRRSTRRNGDIKTRHHYFDRISARLRRDEADISSTALGTELADSIIRY